MNPEILTLWPWGSKNKWQVHFYSQFECINPNSSVNKWFIDLHNVQKRKFNNILLLLSDNVIFFKFLQNICVSEFCYVVSRYCLYFWGALLVVAEEFYYHMCNQHEFQAWEWASCQPCVFRQEFNWCQNISWCGGWGEPWIVWKQQ